MKKVFLLFMILSSSVFADARLEASKLLKTKYLMAFKKQIAEPVFLQFVMQGELGNQVKPELFAGSSNKVVEAKEFQDFLNLTVTNVFAATFTEAELKELGKFLSSDVGKKFFEAEMALKENVLSTVMSDDMKKLVKKILKDNNLLKS